MKKVKNKLIHYKENKLFEWIIPSIALSTVIGVIMFMITLDAEYNFEQIFMKILFILSAGFMAGIALGVHEYLENIKKDERIKKNVEEHMKAYTKDDKLWGFICSMKTTNELNKNKY